MTDTLSFSEAADYLKISTSTLSELATTGEIPGAKISQRWVFLRSELEKYLLNQIKQQTSERREAFLSGSSAKVTPVLGRVKKRRHNHPELPPLPEAA